MDPEGNMQTLNNWLESNFLDIAAGKSNLFQVQFHPYKFTPMKFDEAAEYTAKLISFLPGPLYLGLTGGSDSEFVARTLVKFNIPFEPIIVASGANFMDVMYAVRLCDELKLKPIKVTVTQNELLRYYRKHIAPANSDGLTHVHQMLAVEKAKELNGTIILGETHVYDPEPRRAVVKAFKFLPDLIYDRVIPFYYYTLELTYAEMKAVTKFDDAQSYKAWMRQTSIRSKYKPKYNEDVIHAFQQCTTYLHPDLLMHDMGTPQLFLKYMESFIE
jgi:hypothetical protein